LETTELAGGSAQALTWPVKTMWSNARACTTAILRPKCNCSLQHCYLWALLSSSVTILWYNHLLTLKYLIYFAVQRIKLRASCL
jgi:hypothetical protein